MRGTPLLAGSEADKGHDELARDYGFRFQEPEQALFLCTNEHGITFPMR